MIVDIGAYRDGARIATPTLNEVPGWLDQDGVFVWIGLRMPSRDELEQVSEQFALKGLDIDAALAPHDRPVLTSAGGCSWLVLRTARYHEDADTVQLGELSMLYDEKFVITMRYGQASPLTGVRGILEAQPERLRRGSTTVVSAIIGQVIEDYSPALDGLEYDVLEAENDVFDGGSQPPIRRLYLLKRQILQLLVVGDAVQEPLARLMRAVPVEERGELQLALDQLDRVANRTRTLSDLVTTAINANLTLVSIQQNEDMRRISAWVAMAAVPTLLAGLYGMNFDSMPELRWRFGYPFALLLMAATVLILYRLFRRSRWL